MKYNESPQRPRSHPGIEQRILQGQQVEPELWCQVLKQPCSEIYESPRKSLVIQENPWKSWKRWKSVEYDESRQRTRSHPGIEHRFLYGQPILPYRFQTAMPEIHVNLCTSFKFLKNLGKAIKRDRSPQRTKSQPGIEQRILWGNKCHLQKSKPASMQKLSLLFQGQQLHLQSALTCYHRGIDSWRGRRQRR